jgi:hypothetical protein
MGATLTLPALRGGGIALGWKCSSRCRHCLYGCGPHRRDGRVDRTELDQLLDLLADRAPYARYHIGGGEPFLDVDLLERTIAGLAERGLALEYVETNAGWVDSTDHAARVLERLARVGLECVLVSVSPFHAEHVPFSRTRQLISAAGRALKSGAFVWLPHMIPDLSGLPDGERLAFEREIDQRGDAYALSIGDRYGLIPGGRAGRYLARHGRRIPWRDVADDAGCRDRLLNTTHFHVDGDGLYVPGLCAGLALPLEELPGPIDLDRYPVLATLLETDGLTALVERAIELGFDPLDGYAGACDLCTHVRSFLFERERSAELGPAGFYDPRSLPGYKG